MPYKIGFLSLKTKQKTMFEKLKSRLLELHFNGMRRGALWQWFDCHSKKNGLTETEIFRLRIETILLTQNTKKTDAIFTNIHSPFNAGAGKMPTLQ